MAFSFLVSFLFLSLLYRARLYASLAHGMQETGRPDQAVLALSVWGGFYSDLLTALALTGVWLQIVSSLRSSPALAAAPSRLSWFVRGGITLGLTAAMAAEVFVFTKRLNPVLIALPVFAVVFDWLHSRQSAAPGVSRLARFLQSIAITSGVCAVALAGVIWFAGDLWRNKFFYHVWLPLRYAIIVWVGWAAWGLVIWGRRQPRLAAWMSAFRQRWAALVLGGLLVCLLALGTFAHYHVWLELESGLSWSLIGSSWGQFGAGDFARFIPRDSYFFLGAPLVMFVLVATWPGLLRQHAGRGLGVMLVIAMILSLVMWNRPARVETTLNPIHYLTWDCVGESARWFRSSSTYQSRKDLPGPAQMKSVRAVDETFRGGALRPPVLTPPAPTRPWNVVLLVFESTGAEYAFDTSLAGEPPMPFLKHLCENGLWLQNHYATANSSSEAYFAIFTGIYPCPGNWNGTTTDNHAPALNKLLGKSYHSFLVHPSSRTYAFPHSVLENSGLENLYDRQRIPAADGPDNDFSAREETKAVAFFLERISQAQQPFLAMYASYVPHHPYPDYGPEYRLIKLPKTERQYYYNNLRLLDTQLRRIYEHLESKGLLESTIIMVTGDHGEAFGQHPGVWKHSFSTYDEMFRTPGLLYQPRLFPPTVVRHPTSHVDFVPTLLDAMGVAYNEKLLQGESLFRSSDRKYIFTLTRNDGYYTAIGNDGIKVSVCYKRDSSYAHDLAKDPRETVKLPAERFPVQLEALLKFHNYQLSLFPAYNEAARSGQPFHGERHPPLTDEKPAGR